MKIHDVDADCTNHLADLKDAGVEVLIRYDDRLNPRGAKQIKPAEAKAIGAAGLRLGIVYEGAGDQVGQFSDAIGYEDAKYSRAQAAERDQPDGSAVYFAVDFDPNAFQLKRDVLAYFQGVRRAFMEPGGPKLRVGVYGSGLTCQTVVSAGLAELTWVSCSMGWSESHVYVAGGKWNLRQHQPQTVAGLDTDPNEVNPLHPDIGDFTPYAVEPAEPEVAAVAIPAVAAPVPQPAPVPAPAPPAAPWVNRGIVATEFGGRGDAEESAYGGMVDPAKPGVALPSRFHGARPAVLVTQGGKSAECQIVDVGPHRTDDAYWTERRRPMAEAEPGNHAGIDLTPAVFDALGLVGPQNTRTATVDWSFIGPVV
jgi:hypothetical protein